MAAQKVTKDDFIAAWQREGNAPRTAAALGISERYTHTLRKRYAFAGHDVATRPEIGYEKRVPDEYRGDGWTFERERPLEIDTGTVVVFSDAHYQPGEPTIAHKALIQVIRAVKPRAVIANGDIFDGGSIGRHDPFGWSQRPSVKEELEACIERLGDVEQAVPKGCDLIFTIGNHDIRFERNLVSKVPDYANVIGMRLEDHFNAWELAWSAPINWDSAHPVMVKHRFGSGIHAGYTATTKAGWTTVSGHTHQLDVKSWGDYRGRRWGIQTGCLADLGGAAFEYTENGPSPSCSGFVVLTFRDSSLTPPETCEVIGGKAWFRGQVVAE